jgi:hypothetical protein
MRTKARLRYAPENLSGLRTDSEYHLHEKSPSAFVADVSDATDRVTMGKITTGRILHQQHHA